ncbi:asparaginase [Idiomarina sp. A28L]|uniref:isoaspartyl peptidase/L-asparaginase family protein n=1 Tax=Idiomarina sp. A28L TaxID=1036674 RepID=UPI0002138921|nr:isoaspartyl peptidase/L-asparaginase [Idiomarina sp. A28L]EGN74946.1 asparaginase [Idiomarina sp. A28L]
MNNKVWNKANNKFIDKPARKTLLSAAVLAAAFGLSACSDAPESEQSNTDFAATPIAIAIHGGAGTITRESMSPEREAQFNAALDLALEMGYSILENGGTSADAVIAAIQSMEDNPLFNAGKGAVYTYEGGHELDASIMHGGTRNAGAVSGVGRVKSPIELAQAVMDNSRHVMLSGVGAEQFAREQGLTMVHNSYFNTEHRFQQLQEALDGLQSQSSASDYRAIAANEHTNPIFNMGTVGAVALDVEGNLVAGTSTGGMTAKQYGRIGDSPIIGAGTWADNESCAVSATGHGEYFIRYHVAADICNRVKYLGETIDQAGEYVIHETLLPVGGTGGVIILDAAGNVSMPFNTEGMYRGFKTSNAGKQIGIYKQ